jgi:outer membrane biosynthesis protein TonB
MTLAVILAVSSLLGGIASSGQLPDRSFFRLQGQQSSDSKPAQTESKGQEQTSPESPPKEPASKEEPAQTPTEQQPGKPEGEPGKPSVEKPAEEAPAPAPGKSENAPPAARKPKHKKRPAKPQSGPKKIIVREGSTAEPTTQLTPGMPHDEATHSRQTTTWLLSSTQDNLQRAATRTLSSNQQGMVEQIKLFVDQANAALKEGDIQRSHNLAMKAHLLSTDLLKH